MERRSLYYWSKIYFESLGEGHNYRKLPNVIAINIIDFNFLPGENVHTCFNLREAANPTIILSHALEIHFINMVKWGQVLHRIAVLMNKAYASQHR